MVEFGLGAGVDGLNSSARRYASGPASIASCTCAEQISGHSVRLAPSTPAASRWSRYDDDRLGLVTAAALGSSAAICGGGPPRRPALVEALGAAAPGRPVGAQAPVVGRASTKRRPRRGADAPSTPRSHQDHSAAARFASQAAPTRRRRRPPAGPATAIRGGRLRDVGAVRPSASSAAYRPAVRRGASRRSGGGSVSSSSAHRSVSAAHPSLEDRM